MVVQDDDGDFISLKRNDNGKFVVEVQENAVVAAVILTKEQFKQFIEQAKFELDS